MILEATAPPTEVSPTEEIAGKEFMSTLSEAMSPENLESVSLKKIEKNTEVGGIDGKEFVDILKEVMPPEDLKNTSLEEAAELLNVLNDASTRVNSNPREILLEAIEKEAQINVTSK